MQKKFTLATPQTAKVTMDKAAVAKVVGTAFREANAESKNVKSIIRSVQNYIMRYNIRMFRKRIFREM